MSPNMDTLYLYRLPKEEPRSLIVASAGYYTIYDNACCRSHLISAYSFGQQAITFTLIQASLWNRFYVVPHLQYVLNLDCDTWQM